MADGELNVDSLITRLLEGESGPGGPRGGDAFPYPSWSLRRWSPREHPPPNPPTPPTPASLLFPPRGGRRGWGRRSWWARGAASGREAGREVLSPRAGSAPRTFGDPHGGARPGRGVTLSRRRGSGCVLRCIVCPRIVCFSSVLFVPCPWLPPDSCSGSEKKQIFF